MLSLACGDCGFESRRKHGCLSVVCVVYFQVDVYAAGRSLVQRSPIECVCVCVCVIKRVHFQPSAMNRYEEVSLLKKKKISIC